jgi:GxxExxY protein
MPVIYKGLLVGDYYADIPVEGSLISELKCVDELTDEHLAQVLKYLKATDLNLALPINSQHPKVQWRRVFRNK